MSDTECDCCGYAFNADGKCPCDFNKVEKVIEFFDLAEMFVPHFRDDWSDFDGDGCDNTVHNDPDKPVTACPECEKYLDRMEHAAETVVNAALSRGHLRYDWDHNRIVTMDNKTWFDAAQVIVQRINDDGFFHYGSVDALIRVGPYEDVQAAVISHVHWLRDEDADDKLYSDALV